MTNSSEFLHITLAAYFDIGPVTYLCFLMMLCLYVSIIVSNLLLIVVICKNRSLHQPMYLLLCSLFVNELWGSTGVFPLLLSHLISEVHSVSFPLCFLQIYVVYTYANVQICNLAVMSYDRYLAICCPLQYHTLMSQRRTLRYITVVWLYPFVAIGVLTALSGSLQLCGSSIDKVYCDNYSIVKLSCHDTSANNIYGMIYTAVTLGVVLLICFSYVRILRVCFSGSRQSRQKALSTCSPQLASLINFSCGCFFEIIQNRLDMTHLHHTLRVSLSLYWLSCQPLMNPVMYGLKVTKIRITCKSLLLAKSIKPV